MNNTTVSERDCFARELSSAAGRLYAAPGKLSRWLNHRAPGLAPLFPRVLLAYEFGEAGLEKLHGENWFADLAFPFPFNLLPADVSWTMAAGLELIAPFALLLGLATRFFSLALMVLTAVAIAAVHWPEEWHSLAELWKGYAITDRGYGNYKLPLNYLLLLSSLVLSGGGRLSLDAWLNFDLNPFAHKAKKAGARPQPLTGRKHAKKTSALAAADSGGRVLSARRSATVESG